MSDSQYEIIFRGDIVLGHQLADVKARLQQLFKVDAVKVEALFSGKPVVLKRGLDQAAAQKYKDALIKAGAQVTVQTPTAQAHPTGSSPTGSSVQSASTKTSTVQSPAIWTLAPVGSYLLQTKERAPFVPRQIDTSFLTLRAEGGNLLDAKERKAQPDTEVRAPNFQLAEVGALLIDAAHKIPLPEVEIELEDWTLADLGTDLITPAERQAAPAQVIKVPDLGLAPVGSVLGQIKPEVKVVQPDISGLCLVEESKG